MYIDFNLLKKNGYSVDVQENHETGAPEGVQINGAASAEASVAAIHDGLQTDFPHVDSDSLASIAFRAVAQAQGLDIVRICANR